MKALIVAALAAATLTACGGGGGSSGKSTMPPDINTVAVKVHCTSPAPEQTDELYVREAVTCADGRRVITFNTNKARDSFKTIATEFGSIYDEGNGYLVEH